MPFRRKSAQDISLTPDEALAKLEHFCAFRERSPKEVREKLASLHLDAGVAEKIYALLEAEKFFNEARYAESYARGKFRTNHWGRVRIRLELQRQAIAPACIEQALDAAIAPDEYERLLRQLLDRKRHDLERRGDEHARQKAAAALIRAGFEPELVFSYL